ncbi:MAG TPA: ribonuclease Z [Blastocatellia bacterium]|nr:ribonuclease Z [Blastocatellia bacterium]
MKIIPLGTSSGKPTLKRNVSAVAVAWEGEWLLFDCGEGTQIQVMKAGLHTKRLSAIFITHLHGDHFNGLAGFLSTMGLDKREQSLAVVGPPGLREFLETITRLKILYLNYDLEVREFGKESFREPDVAGTDRTSAGSAASEPLLVFETPDYVVSTLPLDHRIFAIGYRVQERDRPGKFDLEMAKSLGIPEGPLYGKLQHGSSVTLADGRTIEPWQVVGPPRRGKAAAYCTDTRPCDNAIKLGRGTDLMIHEATYTDDLKEEARQYGHSTARQAGKSARTADAKRLLITHISARYPDAAPLLNEAKEMFPLTELAEDLKDVEV